MPRFFFNLRDGDELRDEEGLILADAEAVREEALRNARDIMAEEVRHGHLCLKDKIEVADEAGEPVLTLPFRAAVVIEE